MSRPIVRRLGEPLNRRETQIMDLVVRGFRSKEIEGELEITHDQVNHSLRCVYVKLGATTIAHAAALYARQTTTPS